LKLTRYPGGKVRYTFEVNGVEVMVYCEFITCMIDGKSRKAMTGRGGAYCYHCSISIEDYHTPAGVRVKVRFYKYKASDYFIR
jgi:hypothetical protein